MLEITQGEKRNPIAVDELIDTLSQKNWTGSLYIGYPILSSYDGIDYPDALLICLEHGVVAINFFGETLTEKNQADIKLKQDQLYTALEVQFKRNPQLVKNRKLVFDINILTIVPEAQLSEESIITFSDLDRLITTFAGIEKELLWQINETVQGANAIKPLRKRGNVTQSQSYGARLRKIESEIANLDRWQKNAALETVAGVQRIRGLAGSGKTIVLAWKAAYLHALHPDWNIAVTFYTRSLAQQYKELIRRFHYKHTTDEPDWDKVKVLSSWGGYKTPGLYAQIAQAHGLYPRVFEHGKILYSSARAFEGVCKELIEELSQRPTRITSLYDVVLIDEGQDLPQPFFELVYLVTRDPKRIVYAYDELQNLGDYEMLPPDELFGKGDDGSPRVPILKNELNQPKQDIVLPICYRNPPWVLSLAHALGLGIYYKGGLIQFFEHPKILEEIGYEVLEGSLELGKDVRIRRKYEAAPKYFYDLITPNEAIICKVFESREEQAAYLAECIERHIKENELELQDFLVILCNYTNVYQDSAVVLDELNKRGIPSHLAGVTTERDVLFKEDSIAVSGIFRAKGNEAPMVYILDADFAYSGPELRKKRNVLFTAITRSKGWVRLFGCGEAMQNLTEEVNQLIKNNYEFRFRIPTLEELRQLRVSYRELTPAKLEEIRAVEDALRKIIRGEIDLNQLPIDLREAVIHRFSER